MQEPFDDEELLSGRYSELRGTMKRFDASVEKVVCDETKQRVQFLDSLEIGNGILLTEIRGCCSRQSEF